MKWPNRGGPGYSGGGLTRGDSEGTLNPQTYAEMLAALAAGGTAAALTEGYLRRAGPPQGIAHTIEDLRRAHRAKCPGQDRSPDGAPLAWTEVIFRRADAADRVVVYDWAQFRGADRFVCCRCLHSGQHLRFWRGDVSERLRPDLEHPRYPDALMVAQWWGAPWVPEPGPEMLAEVAELVNWPQTARISRAIAKSILPYLRAVETDRVVWNPAHVGVARRAIDVAIEHLRTTVRTGRGVTARERRDASRELEEVERYRWLLEEYGAPRRPGVAYRRVP